MVFRGISKMRNDARGIAACDDQHRITVAVQQRRPTFLNYGSNRSDRALCNCSIGGLTQQLRFILPCCCAGHRQSLEITRVAGQGLPHQIETRKNDAAKVLAALIDLVNCHGGADINHANRFAIPVNRRQHRQPPVDAELAEILVSIAQRTGGRLRTRKFHGLIPS